MSNYPHSTGHSVCPILPDPVLTDDLRNAVANLLDHPEGCKCPNNGSGDCDWCVAARVVRQHVGDNQ